MSCINLYTYQLWKRYWYDHVNNQTWKSHVRVNHNCNDPGELLYANPLTRMHTESRSYPYGQSRTITDCKLYAKSHITLAIVSGGRLHHLNDWAHQGMWISNIKNSSLSKWHFVHPVLPMSNARCLSVYAIYRPLHVSSSSLAIKCSLESIYIRCVQAKILFLFLKIVTSLSLSSICHY